MQDTSSLIQVKRAVLHILNLNSGVPIYSDTELDPEVFELLQKHLEKAWFDPSAHDSKISDINPVYKELTEYSDDKGQFIPVSKEFAGKLFQDLMFSGEENTIDFVAVDFLAGGIQHFGILLYKNKQAYTHVVKTKDNKTSNEIIQHYAILPNPSQKADMFAFINMEEWNVKFVDKKRVLEGEETYLLPDRLLNCTMPVSAKDATTKIHKIVNKVAEEFGDNACLMVSKAKAFMLEASRSDCEIEPDEIAEEVFSEHPGMKESFLEQIEHSNIKKVTAADRDYIVKANQKHKIKTDTGIEIIVPSEYMNNPDYIEFVNHPNGKISLKVKNFEQIING